MALITLGEKPPVIKLNGDYTNKKLSPTEIKEAVKNMDSKTRERYLEFLISKVEEEAKEVMKAFSSFKSVLDNSVVCKEAKIASGENIRETYEMIVKILNSDFAGLLDYQIEVLKTERKALIRDLSLAHYNQFK